VSSFANQKKNSLERNHLRKERRETKKSFNANEQLEQENTVVCMLEC
jgi:hypothetical protein